ncbi:alpha/beta hydrolase family protein [Paracoccus xiamenensis]|uniref:alpha/beta hydrolase family protein n=1 Tax=Paracoccus xiamenensis TaxID=2714901 RepID=UPI0014091283|nr:alpha/beta fold hydrolase [Paracoccus xiamenensis]NHF74513.1 alpha/beta fold hydrolase [Paracoccus xiamenensis]
MPTQFRLFRLLFIALIGGAIALLAACASSPSPERLGFRHGEDLLAGQLLLPDAAGPYPAVIFVHGDGALPWDAHGYYRPFMQALNDAGFAVYSWDKPGVGDSTGNWLRQSMQGRADEVAAATAALRQDSRIRPDAIGLLGFSQAGWVMPKAIADDPELAFMISVSGAINWIEQSQYMTRNRMHLQGATEAEVSEALRFDRLLVGLMEADASHEAYLDFMKEAPACCRDQMGADRWTFAKLNLRSDAKEDLRKVDVPVLAVFGNRDLNVDFSQSARVYERILARTPGAVEVVVLPDADHSLLPTKSDRLVSVGWGLTRRIISIGFFGADAFADGAVGLVADWAAGLGLGDQEPIAAR